MTCRLVHVSSRSLGLTCNELTRRGRYLGEGADRDLTASMEQRMQLSRCCGFAEL